MLEEETGAGWELGWRGGTVDPFDSDEIRIAVWLASSVFV